MTFNLIDEPWIPVVVDGQRIEVSLRDVVTSVVKYSGLSLDNPLQAVAIFRQVILPVVIDALGAPRSEQEWADRWKSGLDVDMLHVYLDKYYDRFDLFHSVHPFAQVADLRTAKDESKSSLVLLAEASTGNNVPLFTSRTEANPPMLFPSEAARAMLATQCFDTGGIKPGAVGDPKVKAGKTSTKVGPLGDLGVVIPIGRTLAETIMLNTRIIPQGLNTADRPQWRAAPATAAWQERPPLGILDLLTWQARRIRLYVKDGVVSQVVLASGDRIAPFPQYEPHTAWRQVEKPKPGIKPVKHVSGRASWRGLDGLLATQQPTSNKISSSVLFTQLSELLADDYLPNDLPLQVLSVGVEFGDGGIGIIENTLYDYIPLPIAALSVDSVVRELLIAITKEADDLREAADRFDNHLRLASGGDKLKWDKRHLGGSLIHQFTPYVLRILAGLQREPNRVTEASVAWRQAARKLSLNIIEPVIAATPLSAYQGRAIKENNKEWTYRLSYAESQYRKAVNDALGVISTE